MKLPSRAAAGALLLILIVAAVVGGLAAAVCDGQGMEAAGDVATAVAVIGMVGAVIITCVHEARKDTNLRQH